MDVTKVTAAIRKALKKNLTNYHLKISVSQDFAMIRISPYVPERPQVSMGVFLENLAWIHDTVEDQIPMGMVTEITFKIETLPVQKLEVLVTF